MANLFFGERRAFLFMFNNFNNIVFEFALHSSLFVLSYSYSHSILISEKALADVPISYTSHLFFSTALFDSIDPHESYRNGGVYEMVMLTLTHEALYKGIHAEYIDLYTLLKIDNSKPDNSKPAKPISTYRLSNHMTADGVCAYNPQQSTHRVSPPSVSTDIRSD
ncbi:predicted protein [Sclerotinia sclerotiorum 1980 UF-70]|uniref:Uncharacterized protein n=1 Tax=Sclerotinia sclerotiorum (strain ATCC 18683 / 1980 / Ss-1) TaxID=665079 RepID=A7F9V1_SCLS1|nr:predicted protein [Sclerotinia sclerotiorum 1980 UF-70]EDO00512.1 predicted protein [Sclerotinia sclerotiorum 1980 UF-70]